MLELSPQGLMYARPFWRTFKKRYKLVTLRVGRSFFDGPEAILNWRNDTVSPFERMRTYDPPAQEKLVSFALKRIAELYPELANVKIMHKYGGLIDFTPDWIPVISAIDSCRACMSPPASAVTASASGLQRDGSPPTSLRATRRSSIRIPIVTAASSTARTWVNQD